LGTTDIKEPMFLALEVYSQVNKDGEPLYVRGEAKKFDLLIPKFLKI